MGNINTVIDRHGAVQCSQTQQINALVCAQAVKWWTDALRRYALLYHVVSIKLEEYSLGFGGLEVSEMRRLKALGEENAT